MLRKRLIACLDVKDARVVKGVGFADLRDVGDPVDLATRYDADGADEIVFLDISASAERRGMLLDVLRRTAERLFIPLAVGGGITSVGDIAAALRAGADKVSVNTAAVRRPGIFAEGAARFGSQCIVASIDAMRCESSPSGYRVATHGGRVVTDLDAVAWAVRSAEMGAGEILLTSIDRDGRRSGYDVELTRLVADSVGVPVIASGGAGTADHLSKALLEGGADAALVAGILHDGTATVQSLKKSLLASGIPMRSANGDRSAVARESAA